MEQNKNDVALASKMVKGYEALRKEIEKKIIGQENVVELFITSIFCGGHSLLVGVPGLAKTLLVQTLSECLSMDFSRIQFTPDLMPSDILGTETLDKERNLKFNKGPVFANIILADEINRTPPKTQSALLESMQEKNVTIAGKCYELDKPFFVLATQNPIEQEGTYTLPEAQLDRFMFMINLDYPTYQEELDIVKSTTSEKIVEINQVFSKQDILDYQNLVRRVPVPDNVFEYAVNLVAKTRPSGERASSLAKEFLSWGAGPRAGQFLILAAKCKALLENKYSPDIDHVKSVAIPVLKHRIVRNFKADAEGISDEHIIEELSKTV